MLDSRVAVRSLRLPVLLGEQLHQHRRVLRGVPRVLQEAVGDVRHLAAGIWAFRARAEVEAAERFARLASRLSGVGARVEIVRMAESAASDEERHADLCADLVRHFGGDARARAAAHPREVAPSGLTPRERVLYEVVALSCITETLSAALLGAIVEQALDDRVKQNVHAILRDEIEHGRLGWAHLSLEGARGEVRFLGDYLPAMLESTIDDEIFGEEGVASEPIETVLAGLGALSRADRRALFVETMLGVVFPGLERFGVDTGEGSRWLHRQVNRVSRPTRAC
jgi:hypothetical protein